MLSFARLRLGEQLRCDGARSRLEIAHKRLKDLEGRDLIDGLDVVVVEYTEEDRLLEFLSQLTHTIDSAIERFHLLEHPLLCPEVRQFTCVSGYAARPKDLKVECIPYESPKAFDFRGERWVQRALGHPSDSLASEPEGGLGPLAVPFPALRVEISSVCAETAG